MFKVQTGKGRGKYQTRYSLSSREQAEMYYAMLNIHSGFKKRLVSPDGVVIARYISS